MSSALKHLALAEEPAPLGSIIRRRRTNGRPPAPGYGGDPWWVRRGHQPVSTLNHDSSLTAASLSVFRSCITERKTTDEVPAGAMAGFYGRCWSTG